VSDGVSRSRLRFATAAALIIALPVFFEPTRGGLRLSPAYSEAVGESVTALSFSVLALPLLLAVLLASARARRRHVARPALDDALVAGYVVVNALALYTGVVLAGVPEPLGMMAYLQSLFPLVGYAVARITMETAPGETPERALEPLERFLITLGLGVLVYLFLYVVQTVIDGVSTFRLSIITDHIGPFYNYKMKRFFPVYVAMATASLAAYILASRRLRGPTVLIAGALVTFGVVGLFLMHSRTALLFLVVAMSILSAGTLRVFRPTVSRRFARLSVLVLLGVALAWPAISAAGTRSLARIYETVTVVTGARASLAPGDETRLERMRTGVEVGFGSVFGSGFQMEERHGLRRAVTTESGYLDIVARAGPLALALVLALVARSVLASYRLARRVHAGAVGPGRSTLWAARALLALLTGFALIGNVFLNVLTEPYVGPAYWFLLGSVASLARTGRARDSRWSGPGTETRTS